MIFRMAACFAITILMGTEISRAEQIPTPGNRPDCATDRRFGVVDFSLSTAALRADDGSPALARLKSDFGISTVFRYYDHENETLPGKTLTGSEADAIIAAGLKIGVVFQHHNDDPAKFLDPASGKRDAERALKLADSMRQPYGSAIYFGVDGPERHLDPLIAEYSRNGGNAMLPDREAELRAQGKIYFISSYAAFIRFGREALQLDQLDQVTPAKMQPVIERYFAAIRDTFRAYAQSHAGKTYKIGMYCTGAMCLLGDNRRLADYFWVSPEGRNDQEYRQFLSRRDKWHLVQQLPTVCSGWKPASDRDPIEFDFNYVNPLYSDYGQWAARRQ